MQYRLLTPPVIVAVSSLVCDTLCAQQPEARFTRLDPVPPPRIIACADEFPGANFKASNLTDGNPRTEYSSNGKGTNTFVEFDFGHPLRIAAFRHADRNDPATIARSELKFLDASGETICVVAVAHVNRRAGVTFLVLPSPVTAQRVRWGVTALGSPHGTVGGAEIAFFQPGMSEALPSATKIDLRFPQMLERAGGHLVRPLQIKVDYPYAEGMEASLRIDGGSPQPLRLSPGSQTQELRIPAASAAKQVTASIEIAGQRVVARSATLKPVGDLKVYLLPHSHVDIGYTELQAAVEKKQNNNIETGLKLAQATAGYPAGARFKWNAEVLWSVENYLRVATPPQRAAFISAVKAGRVGLDAFYGNILTGLCRPEELVRLMSYAQQLSRECGVPITSAMISDVPGYTWSTVSAMAQAGVKYFSFAPNYLDRIGGTMREWQNRPFWWQGPDGKERVLCWCPSLGYALGHVIGDGEALARYMPTYLEQLETNAYPYEISCLRWNVHGDNGSPDEKLSDVVRDWNARHASPTLVIATTAEAFGEFERRYGEKLPVFKGDYTPYWEDGAASSAAETALNRASADRLVQAETLWAMRNPGPFPSESFRAGWRNVLLYSEHTWGAHNSISQPDLPFVLDQWKVKRGFALDADKLSRELLAKAAEPTGNELPPDCVDVFNTSSWERTDLVTLPAELSRAGDRVLDDRNRTIPSQRLASGELAFVARNVPAFSARRFRIGPGSRDDRSAVSAAGAQLSHPDYTVAVDATTGAISSLFSRRLRTELVDPLGRTALNDYFYLPGSDLKGLQRNGPPRISVKEKGPVVASLLIESEAPGCRRLTREVRVVDGLDRVEIINTIDKLPIRAKEGIHFGYGFGVPNGTVRMDVGLAVIRPEADQIPAACKNWFSVQRWVDISNDKFGVTWSPLDAPLVEIGGITANLIGSQTDPAAWIQHLPRSQTLYSWVMNNHWHTNYRAEQEGPAVFRYAIRVHRGFSPLEAETFGVGCSQPLLPFRASGKTPPQSPLQFSSDVAIVNAFKPADDGTGWVVRLYNASGQRGKVKLKWNPARAMWQSDTGERPLTAMGDRLEIPAWGLTTIRAE